MKSERKILVVALVVLALAMSIFALDQGGIALAQGPRPGGKRAPRDLAGTGFTYEGQLKKNGALINSTCNFTFTLYSDQGGTTPVGSPSAVTGVNVASGLFTATVDSGGEFGTFAFNGDARWLKTAVKCTGDGSVTTLSPLQPIAPAPYALALPGLYTQQNNVSPNVIGGYSGNIITPTLNGATIGGGGQNGYPNRVWADYGTIGGGSLNTASGWHATVGGGYNNTASGDESSVAGGGGHYATGVAATIGGGDVNTAYGNYATVPGGRSNSAAGDYSFAAGRNAQAPNQGSFVWADSTNANFSSTANNQFLIRAAGGVGISTTNPTANLEVAGGDLKVSKSGSGVIFPDASKQTSAASKVIGHNEIYYNDWVTTTSRVLTTVTGTLTVGTTALLIYGADYEQISDGAYKDLGISVYVDGVWLDGAEARWLGVNNTLVGSTLNKSDIVTCGSGTHTFELRANSNVPITGTVYVGHSWLTVIQP